MYDVPDQLTSASYPNGDTVSYGYDAVGNRTSLRVNGTATTSTFDAANRLTAVGSTTYTYDANGNQTGRTAGGVTTTYTYDALDRLTAISGPTTANYASNADGLRVSKTVGGITTNYAWDPTGLPTVLADGNEYIRGHGLIGQMTTGNAMTYAHTDGLGSIRLLTDGTGALVGTQQYDAFGMQRAQSGMQLAFGYTGDTVDTESGLLYLRSRYYDPTTGRFLQSDPFAGSMLRPTSQNRYSYVENNPLRWVDHSGARPVDRGDDCPPEDLEQRCNRVLSEISFFLGELIRRAGEFSADHQGLSEGNVGVNGTTYEGYVDIWNREQTSLNIALQEWSEIEAQCAELNLYLAPDVKEAAETYSRLPIPEPAPPATVDPRAKSESGGSRLPLLRPHLPHLPRLGTGGGIDGPHLVP